MGRFRFSGTTRPAATARPGGGRTDGGMAVTAAKVRLVAAGAIMAGFASALLNIVDKDWRAALFGVVGFASGALWWRCVGEHWDGGA